MIYITMFVDQNDNKNIDTKGHITTTKLTYPSPNAAIDEKNQSYIWTIWDFICSLQRPWYCTFHIKYSKHDKIQPYSMKYAL